MKRLVQFFVLSMAIFLSSTSYAQTNFNAQGSTTVSGMYYAISAKYITLVYPWLILTNTSSSTVRCKVTIYDNDGNDVSTLGLAPKDTDRAINTDTDGSFEIPPHCTQRYVMKPRNMPDAYMMGYATIEWKSSDTQLRNALIGSMRSYTEIGKAPYTTTSTTQVQINNGQAF